MTSPKNKDKIPELSALFRLEFYRNKKQWKLSNEKTKKSRKPANEPPASEPPKDTESSNKLNETYSVDSTADNDKCQLNNAFIQDIPYDTPPAEPLKSALPSEAQDLQPDLLAPAPQLHIGTWSTQQGQCDKFVEDWSNGQDFEPSKSKVCPDIWPKQPDGPGDNLQWLLKTASMTWTQQPPPEHSGVWNYPPTNPGSFEGCSNKARMDGTSLQQPNTWTCTSSGDKGEVNSLKTQNHPWHIEMPPPTLFNPDKWTNLPAVNQKQQFTPGPTLQEPKFQKSLAPEDWRHQKYLPDIWPTQAPNGPQLGPLKPPGGPQQMLKDYIQLCNEKSQVGRSECVPEMWYNLGLISESKHEDTWSCPVPPSSPEEITQNLWTNQLWEQKQWQNADKEWQVSPSDDVPDGPLDKSDCSMHSDYCGTDEQYTSTPAPSQELRQSPELVRENTSQWLRLLMAQYHHCYGTDDDAPVCEHDHGHDFSTEFVREAHSAPHSSEKDPDDSCDCVCWYVSQARVSRLPGAVLARAASRLAALLRALLLEQTLRDRLRLQAFRKLEEQPTKDTNVFGDEYVLSGSHIPQSSAELSSAGDSVIKINMGRPYRLRGNTNNF